MRERRTSGELVLERRRTDAEVKVVIEMPGDEKSLEVSGRVARLARRKDDPPGFGVEFDDLEEPARARIAELVDDALADLS